MVQLLLKIVWQFWKQLNIELSCDLAIPLLGVYPKQMKTSLHKILYIIFIAALFIIDKK